MKELTNWRKGVIYALLAIGIVALLIISGQPTEAGGDGEWTTMSYVLLAISAISFYLLGHFAKKWDSEDKSNKRHDKD